MDLEQLAEFKKGKNREQVKVIDYFTKSGCLSGAMSDEQYRLMVYSRRDSLQSKKRALDKIGLDEDQVKEIAPAYFEGFWFDNAWAKRTNNGNGQWVSSAYQVSWLFFSDSQIYLFSHTFHMDEDKKSERTDEFFYKDVTSFSTTTENKKIKTATEDKKNKSAGANEISVETQMFSLTVPGDKFFMSMSDTKDAEQIIQGMKQKLREKKANPPAA